MLSNFISPYTSRPFIWAVGGFDWLVASKMSHAAAGVHRGFWIDA